MDENSDRKIVIALLEKLGHEDDAEVLAAGRALHAKIDEMSVSWEQLLVPDDNDVAETVDEFDDDDDDDDGDDDIGIDEFQDDDDDGDTQGADATADDGDTQGADATADDGDTQGADATADDDFEPVGDAADDVKLIDRLLATSGISSDFRDELKGYKEDIKAGEFSAADRKYVQALQRRLSGDKKSKSRR